MTLNSEGLEKPLCATEDCERIATQRVEAGGVGSDHCDDCAEIIRRQRALPPVDGLEVAAWEDPGLTCPHIDAAIASGELSSATIEELCDIRDINSQLRYGTWHLRSSLSQASSVIAGLKDERDEAIRRGEDQWAGWVKEEVARKAAEARISSLEEEIKRLREIVKAVAHIGVDFGFGPYELEHHFIEDARQALGDHNG